MSAPKPKVFRANGRWNFECEGCREPKQRGYFDHWTAVRAATDHSRTHTAERVEDELMRRYLSAKAEELASRDRRDWAGGEYWMGRKDEALGALALIRRYLV